MKNINQSDTNNNLKENIITTVLGSVTESSTVSKEKTLIPKDFFWDGWLSYLTAGILTLALIDVSVEFLSGNTIGMLCFVRSVNGTSEDFNRDESAFINSWCSQLLPRTEYLPLFTFIQGISLYIPHYIWHSLFSSYFDFYFALTSMLERLRDRNTGNYAPQNSSIIQRLEEEFASRRSIILCYVAKLFLQGAILVLFITLSSTIFTDFQVVIICPPESEPPSQAFGRVQCVYNRFRFLSVLRIADIILLSLGLIIVITGFAVFVVYGYIKILANRYQHIGEFSYRSSLNPTYFQWSKRNLCSQVNQLSDLDFLLFKLFATDAGYAKIFCDIQVSEYIARLLEADYENLHIRARMKNSVASNRGIVMHVSP